MNPDILPCPFCRAAPKTYQHESLPRFWTVVCPTCQASGPLAHSESNAIHAWNAREHPLRESGEHQ